MVQLPGQRRTVHQAEERIPCVDIHLSGRRDRPRASRRAGHRFRRTDRHLQSGGHPDSGLPAHRQHPGAGAALKLEFKIRGSEYDEGHPPPLIGVNVRFPTGSKLHPQGFPTCSPSALKETGEPAIGTAACPKKSLLTFPVSKPSRSAKTPRTKSCPTKATPWASSR